MHVVLKPDVFYGGKVILIQILCCRGKDSELKKPACQASREKGRRDWKRRKWTPFPFPSLRKQPTFCDANTGFPSKWRLRNERRKSTLMTRHYPDLGSAADRLKQISHSTRPIKSTTHIQVVTRDQCRISALVSQTSFRAATSGDVAKCRLFSQVTLFPSAFFSPSSHPVLHLLPRLGIKLAFTFHG